GRAAQASAQWAGGAGHRRGRFAGAGGAGIAVRHRHRAPREGRRMKPLVLIPSGEADADFTYASGFPVEAGLYIRFEDGDDVLVASPLEIERARVQSKDSRKLGLADAVYFDQCECWFVLCL